jgi:hypothetical protein
MPLSSAVGRCRPEISIIIPFDDPRGDPRFVKSWTQAQTCAAERFEVIVVTSGASPQLDAQLRSHLRPHDRLIATSATNRFGYYDPGVQAAQGPLVLLTEDHCVADRHCLERTLAFFREHPQLAGAFLDSGHINATSFAQAEQRLYERMFAAHWSRDDYWDKLRIRGSVLRRDAYFAAGGLTGDYDHFAETLLSARLHRDGFAMGFVPGAVVRHVNTTSFRMMSHEVLRFAAGECRYRAQANEPELEPYLGMPVCWAERQLRSPQLARRAARALAVVIRQARERGDRHAVRTLTRQRRCCLLDARLGYRWRDMAFQWQIALAKLRFRWARHNKERRADCVRQFWQTTNELGRLRACALQADSPPAIDVTLGQEISIATTVSSRLTGFHAAETWQGIPFRWSSCIALLTLAVAPGDYELTIDTAGLRGPLCDFPRQFVWNDTPLAESELRIAEGRITCSISAAQCAPGAVQQLLLVAAGPPPTPGAPADPRSLGLPVRAIELSRAAASRLEHAPCVHATPTHTERRYARAS